MSLKLKTISLVSVSLIFVIFIFVDPISQPKSYHLFSDTRYFFGITNFFNVASNIPFLIIGIAGLILEKKKTIKEISPTIPLYQILFVGVFLTGIGSGYYHLAPDNQTLVWDRLPMVLVFAAFTASVLAEHLGGLSLEKVFYLLLVLGLGSVIYWHIGESADRGDLRPYLLVEFLPMILLPVVMLTHNSQFTRRWEIWWALGCYGLAKGFELCDGAIYQLGGLISGHTLKHLAAATALLFLLDMLSRRKRLDT